MHACLLLFNFLDNWVVRGMVMAWESSLAHMWCGATPLRACMLVCLLCSKHDWVSVKKCLHDAFLLLIESCYTSIN